MDFLSTHQSSSISFKSVNWAEKVITLDFPPLIETIASLLNPDIFHFTAAV